MHKVLAKHYNPVAPTTERPVIEHLLFACCLENARYDLAEEALAKIVDAFFDWNEVRVSSVRELSEVMARLPDPPAAATRLKKVLQHVFEDGYTFDLEALRKKNLGPAQEEISKIDGVSSFMVSYVVQTALGGHSIPIDSGVIRVMEILDLISEKDAEAGVVPGLERAIPKSKGIEFGSQLHQLGADMTDDPFSSMLREILLEIDPKCKARLPRKPGRKKPAAKAKQEETAKKAEPKAAKKKTAAGKTTKAAKTTTTKSKKKDTGGKKPTATAKAPKKKAVKKKTVTTKKKSTKSSAAGKSTKAKKNSGDKISKRKPR
ncbi:MAG: hypothetical protein JXM70_04645 [Pirellulales bacterium]|nr:hypothetical protein [Pirellulales bacterium]